MYIYIYIYSNWKYSKKYRCTCMKILYKHTYIKVFETHMKQTFFGTMGAWLEISTKCIFSD